MYHNSAVDGFLYFACDSYSAGPVSLSADQTSDKTSLVTNLAFPSHRSLVTINCKVLQRQTLRVMCMLLGPACCVVRMRQACSKEPARLTSFLSTKLAVSCRWVGICSYSAPNGRNTRARCCGQTLSMVHTPGTAVMGSRAGWLFLLLHTPRVRVQEAT